MTEDQQHDLDLTVDTAANTDCESTVNLGVPPARDSNTQLNIARVPDALSPGLDWYHERPIMYFYGVNTEEPAYMIALPTENDPQPRLISSTDELPNNP